ncbi:hypothetical protein [Streptomyces sp. NPDC049555]|uniref:hypothetical protein n=1 Tax=Streptomyces sp. NPDC049555 TaxID=3154930 RepID=UPI00343985CA
MRNGKAVGAFGVVLLAGAATFALPGVTLCGGSAAGSLLAAVAPALTAVAVYTSMTRERKPKAAPAGPAAEAVAQIQGLSQGVAVE